MTKLLGRTAAGKIIPVCVDDNGHVQIDLLSITAGLNLIGRVDAKHGDKIISIKDTIGHSIIDEDAPAGSYSFLGTACPANQFWHLTTIWWRIVSASYSLLRVYGKIQNTDVIFHVDTAPVTGQYYQKDINVWLAPDDFVYLRLTVLTAGDDCYMGYAGKIMEWE